MWPPRGIVRYSAHGLVSVSPPSANVRQLDVPGGQQTKLLVKRGTVLDVAVEDLQHDVRLMKQELEALEVSWSGKHAFVSIRKKQRWETSTGDW